MKFKRFLLKAFMCTFISVLMIPVVPAYATLEESNAEGQLQGSAGMSAIDWAFSDNNWGYKITYVYNKKGEIQEGSRVGEDGNVALRVGVSIYGDAAESSLAPVPSGQVLLKQF